MKIRRKIRSFHDDQYPCSNARAIRHHLAEQLERRVLLSNPAFYTGEVYAAGEGASVIIAADFNGDGKPDLATGNYTQSNVSILLNKGDGTFAAHTDYGVGQNPRALVAADLNGDNGLDLVAANADDNTISVVLNVGQGQFASKVDYASGVDPASLAAADFTGDGPTDIAVANAGDQNLRLFKNLGDGTFAPMADIPLGASYATIAAADLNNDGRADLAIASSYKLRLLLGNGDGTFTDGNIYEDPPNYDPRGIIVADMDHNGAQDLVIGTSYNGLNIYLNNGDAVLTPSVSYSVSHYGSSNTQYAAGDFNGDGYTDIVATFSSYSYLSTPTLLLNQRDGTLSEPIDVAYTGGSVMTAADFNGDGRSDMAADYYDFYSKEVGVAVSINAGTSLFGPRYSFGVDARPGGVIPADFNNDGLTDLFVQGSTVGSYVELQNVDGTFSFSNTLRIDDYALAAADLNGDGRLDAISAGGIYLNNGNGAFGSFISLFPTAPNYSPGGNVAVGDFNNDGKPDLVANEYGTSTIQVRLNLGNGNFGPASQYVGGGPLVAADFNGDGQIDIAAWMSGGVKILKNTGNTFTDGSLTPIRSGAIMAIGSSRSSDLVVANADGLFLLRNTYGGGNFDVLTIDHGDYRFSDLAQGDFNGDNIVDIATTGAIALNAGNGIFGRPVLYPVGQYAQGVASADFNNDGRADLAWTNFYSNSVTVMLNDYVRTDIPAPTAPHLDLYYDTGRSQSDNVTNSTAPLFTGSGGEAGMTVVLYVDGVEAGRSCVDTFGGWSIFARALSDGRHVVVARQGNAFGASIDSAPLVVTVDTTPPVISSASFDFLHVPHTATIGYSEEVSWSLGANDFELTNLTTGATFTLAHSYYSGSSHVQSINSPILPDGNYILRVKSAGVMDIAGNTLPADYDLSFFVLAGDANHDRKIDATDLGILSANWQGTNKTFSQGDFNYDRKVDINDLYILASKWQQTLAPPPPATAPASAGVRAPARSATRVVSLVS